MEKTVINRQHATAPLPDGLPTVPAIASPIAPPVARPDRGQVRPHANTNLYGESARAWWVYPVDGSKAPTRFVGTTEEMVAHINAAHLATDIQYAAREIGQ